MRALGKVSAAAGAILLIGSLVGGAGPAFASHGAGAASGKLNTAAWRVCNSGFTASIQATTAGLNAINATDVNPVQVGCPTNYNVSVVGANYPDTWYGLTSCNSAVSGGLCSSKSVRLNGRTVTTTQQWNKTALHELGHVGGLGHRTENSSVMAQGASPPVSGALDSHDVASLNANY